LVARSEIEAGGKGLIARGAKANHNTIKERDTVAKNMDIRVCSRPLSLKLSTLKNSV
jgi:hypothetical protein